jgi:hypothetical protein
MRASDFVLATISHFVKADESPPPGIPAHVESGFEKELLDCCAEHGLAPLILDSLSKLSLEPPLSRLTMEKLRIQGDEVSRSNRRFLEEAEIVGEALAGAGVAFMLFGEAALARAAFGNGAAAGMRRLEFMVKEEEWDRVVKATAKLGYSRPLYEPVLKSPGEVVRYHHHVAPCILRKEDGTSVRFRFRLFDYGPATQREESWGDPSRPGSPGSIPVPRREDMLIHSVLEWRMSRFRDLARLVDIGLLTAGGEGRMDWDYVLGRTRRMKLAGTFKRSLAQALSSLGMGRPFDSVPALATPGMRLRMERGDASVEPRRGFKFYMLESDRLAGRMKVLWNVVLAPSYWVSAFFGKPCSLMLRLRFVAEIMGNGTRF